jgi:mono/diheme cytochrome c family protein/polyisoprenoid-binding protein YceI
MRLFVASVFVFLSANAFGGSWMIADEPAPMVRFTVDSQLDSIMGVSRSIAGTAEVDPAQWASGTARVAVDLTSFETGLMLRDEDLRDQFFETDKFARAVLTVKGFERPSAPALAAGKEVESDAVGSLSIHGVERPIRIPVKVRLADAGGRSVIAIHGGFTVAFADYGIKRPVRLFLKLGDTAKVDFSATLVPIPSLLPQTTVTAPSPAPLAPPAVATPKRRRVGVVIAVARRRAKAPPPPVGSGPQRRGEGLFHDPTIGGEGNALTCASCHGITDERQGLTGAEGLAHPNPSLWNGARRKTYWQGLARTPGEASSICTQLFMLRPKRLDDAYQADLAAYLSSLGSDPSPEMDYRVLALTRSSSLPNPLSGNPEHGLVLLNRWCWGCHHDNSARPPLTPGLYEAEYIVQRVRWLGGTDARQMPPITVDRLPDSELRDIVTYLAGEKSQPIFKRRRR